jgi:hypothetical protein
MASSSPAAVGGASVPSPTITYEEPLIALVLTGNMTVVGNLFPTKKEGPIYKFAETRGYTTCLGTLTDPNILFYHKYDNYTDIFIEFYSHGGWAS